MEYKLKFTDKCLDDIEEVCQYIEEKLKAKNAANELLQNNFPARIITEQ